MFTGLVREIGEIVAVAGGPGVSRVDVAAPLTAASAAVGDSVAVNGICLTVVRRLGPALRVEASPETRRLTTLPGWRAGNRVHVEPALRVGDELGGHFVLGHVDGVGRIERLARHGAAASMAVALPAALAALLLPKGSIAVDGVSLTLDEGPFDGGFTVTLVPHTLRSTRFGTARAGERVNLEIDILAKAAAQRAGRPAAHGEPVRPLQLDWLREHGWKGHSR